ncbi:1-deoxy-D-xylulose 5-phosphate reductoisomerase C-terminal family protein [Mycobacterium kansasii]|uniref:1-deoxy-D-xylulose-5-phosphate reductoisomerase n=1 Tax=Mycobacterium kansasii TaxID=1768 RepID=A0A1V3XWH7_MYCKA|nr:1-deoxy-D-xylulose 5-phosphate reductoisomerase C-terminal family protein [Mycobacterium kansasii]
MGTPAAFGCWCWAAQVRSAPRRWRSSPPIRTASRWWGWLPGQKSRHTVASARPDRRHQYRGHRRSRGATCRRHPVLRPDAVTRLIEETEADVVLNALVGALGLRPTLAALESGARLALANKESLVAGGPLVLRAARPGQIVPVDSEHSALAQCLRGGTPDEVAKLVLTASGGPFRAGRPPTSNTSPRNRPAPIPPGPWAR